MRNAMIWARAWFCVGAADIALSVVLFSALGVASVFMGFSIDDLDIQLLQAAAQMASFLMALLWWRYLWPRSFMARWQGERPLGGGAGKAWRRIACVIVIGLALQVVVGYVTDAVLSLLPEAAADYSELVEETGMGETSYLAVLTTVIGAPFCEELLVRGIIFEFSLRAFNPQCRPLWKRRRRASAQGGAMVPWAAPSAWGIAAAIVLQAAIFGFMHTNWAQGCYAGAAGLIFFFDMVTSEIYTLFDQAKYSQAAAFVTMMVVILLVFIDIFNGLINLLLAPRSRVPKGAGIHEKTEETK